MDRRFVIGAGAALVISVLLPWFSVSGFGMSVGIAPWEILTRRFSEGWYFIAPVLGGGLVLFAVHRSREVRLSAFLGGLSPYLPIIVIFVQSGVFSARRGTFGSVVQKSLLENIGNLLGVGIYVAIAASIVLFVAAAKKETA